MSLIDTDGRSARFLTRAQKRAITIESAPSTSKKLLSTETRSTPMMSANTSASAPSALAFEPERPPRLVDGSAGPTFMTSTDLVNTYSLNPIFDESLTVPRGFLRIARNLPLNCPKYVPAQLNYSHLPLLARATVV